MKKLLLGLGAVTTAFAPVVAVISCGQDHASTKPALETKAVSAADFIKKIQPGDKGKVVTIDGGDNTTYKFYISEAETKKNTRFVMYGKSFEIPAMETTFYDTNLSATLMEDSAEKTSKIRIKSWDSVTVDVGKYIIAKRVIASDVADLKLKLKKLATVQGKNKIYDFDFTKDSLTTNTPVLTKDGQKQFEKIFADLGLALLNLVFEKTTVDKVETISIKSFDLISATLTKTTAADLNKLKTELDVGMKAAPTGSMAISSAKDVKVAGKPMTSDQLLDKINSIIKGTGLDSLPAGVNNTLIKDDMHITLKITKAAVPAALSTATDGVATLSISANNLTPVTVTIALPVV